MIISLRGTSGCGKSMLVRTIIDMYEMHRDHYTEGRKKPFYTEHGRNPKGKVVVTPGHYQIANGGMDTLKKLDDGYRIARWAALMKHDVLMEGKNMSDGASRANALLDEGFDIRLVFINEPLEKCIASVRKRGHTIDEKSIEKTLKKVRRVMTEFDGKMYTGNRKQCLEVVKEWLGW